MAIRKLSKKKAICGKLERLSKEYMYLRDGRKCVVCGKAEHLQWGHVFSRRIYATRYDPENYFVQCAGCNLRHTYDPLVYYDWYKQKFGVEKFDNLYIKWKQSSKTSLQDLKNQVDYLENLIHEHKSSKEN